MEAIFHFLAKTTTSSTLDRTVIESLSPKSVVLSLGDLPFADKAKQVLRSMVNCKAMVPDELSVELLMLELFASSHVTLFAFHGIILAVRMTGGYRRSGKTQSSKFYTRRV